MKRETDVRRRWIRAQILDEAWILGFPMLFRHIAHWFSENAINLGFIVSGPVGRIDDPVGLRVGVFTADSPRRALVVGWARLNSDDLKRLAGAGRTVRIRVFGWLRISEDVDATLAQRTLTSVRVTGISRMRPDVRARLAA
jgi:hypothetical protein